MKQSTLYTKTLACAIKDLNYAITKDQANKVYIKWKCFHNNIEFKKAAKTKQEKFKK